MLSSPAKLNWMFGRVSSQLNDVVATFSCRILLPASEGSLLGLQQVSPIQVVLSMKLLVFPNIFAGLFFGGV